MFKRNLFTQSFRGLSWKKIGSWVAGLLFVFIWLASYSNDAHANSCDDQYYQGVRPAPINTVMRDRVTLVCSPGGFEAANWGVSRTGLWSAEHLTRDRVITGKRLNRVDSFHEESRAPLDDRASLDDYARSGFDRGHLAPNKDMGDRKTQAECFTLANMIPQDSDNNRNLWEGIESAVRSYVMTNGDVYVITGPIFPAHGEKARFLKNRVLVPKQIYKVIYDPRKNRASAYLVDNAPGMKWEQVSISNIRHLAQIDLLPRLSGHAGELDLPEPTPHGHGSSPYAQGGNAWGRVEQDVGRVVRDFFKR